jgi:hypothetical protein
MFSREEKIAIASKIEEILLSLNHPEMPKEKADFVLNVKGKESWSWANIAPNWSFDDQNPPSINPFNEISREILSGKEK